MLRVIPLGGLGEVGLNTLVLEHGDERLLVDCGLMFPRAHQLGVDIVVPDYRYLRDEPDKVTGVVLTHAHEDHLGALPLFLREFNVPVWGTPFTLALARHRLEEAGITADLREFGPGMKAKVGQQMTVEPVRVTHSVPDAVGLVIRTPSGTVVHTGDFKLDGMPIDGQLTDLRRLAEVGEEGVSLLLSDSTNAEVPGVTQSERLVVETFERLFSQAKGRIFVAMFGSHLHRVAHAVELAHRLNKKVVLLGRSLQRNVELAQQVGIMKLPSGALVPADRASGLADSQVVVLCTGAQAEPRAALTTLLSPEPGHLRLGPGDTVILSARTIPGNEPEVSHLINRLLHRGAIVIHAGMEPGVHVSGHASQQEQKQMIETVRPTHFVPVHGELKHLMRHSALAGEVGLDESRRHLLTNGDVLGLRGGEADAYGRVHSGQLMMRRDSLSPLSEEALKQRRSLAEGGLITAVVALRRGSGEVLHGPSLTGYGLMSDEESVLPLAAEGAKLALREVSAAVRSDDERVREEVVRGVRRVFKQLLGARPTVMPLVIRLP
jgi:ribonuclease J